MTRNSAIRVTTAPDHTRNADPSTGTSRTPNAPTTGVRSSVSTTATRVG